MNRYKLVFEVYAVLRCSPFWGKQLEYYFQAPSDEGAVVLLQEFMRGNRPDGTLGFLEIGAEPGRIRPIAFYRVVARPESPSLAA